MIFDPQLAEMVRAGRKTVTRRPANGRPCPHRVGSIQKVQPGQGQPALPGRIQLTSVRLEKLSAVNAREARREGYRGAGSKPLRDFLESWAKRYPLSRAGSPVYRIEFTYLPAD